MLRNACSLEKRVLHLDVSTLRVIMSKMENSLLQTAFLNVDVADIYMFVYMHERLMS